MKLCFLRHGIADWENWDKPDEERPLNKEGKKETRRVAAALAKRGFRTDVILTSPLPRAEQTAKILADALGLDAPVEPSLAPGFDLSKLRALITAHDGKDIVLVGHEPDFSETIAALTGGAVVLKKAAIACVRITDAEKPAGELLWLLTPKWLTPPV